MTTVGIEAAFIRECERQGIKPDAAAVQRAFVDLAGRTATLDGTIMVHMPEHDRSLSLPSYVYLLRATMPPDAFATVEEASNHQQPATIKPSNLTEQMRQMIAEQRSRRVPDDWEERRARASGLTKQCMDAIAAGAKSARR